MQMACALATAAQIGASAAGGLHLPLLLLLLVVRCLAHAGQLLHLSEQPVTLPLLLLLRMCLGHPCTLGVAG
jgi:hypothetical protein